jgi:hypothetical protein
VRRAVQFVNPRTSSTTSAIVLFAVAAFPIRSRIRWAALPVSRTEPNQRQKRLYVVGGKAELQQSIKLWAGSVAIPNNRSWVGA